MQFEGSREERAASDMLPKEFLYYVIKVDKTGKINKYCLSIKAKYGYPN